MSLGNKEIFSSNLKRYMDLNDVKATDICNTLHIPMASFSDWVHARTYPRIDKIEMLSNYFGINKSDLIEKHEEEQPSYYNDPESEKLAQFLFDNPNYKVLFDASKNVRPEDIQKVAAMIALMSNKQDN